MDIEFMCARNKIFLSFFLNKSYRFTITFILSYVALLIVNVNITK